MSILNAPVRLEEGMGHAPVKLEMVGAAQCECLESDSALLQATSILNH